VTTERNNQFPSPGIAIPGSSRRGGFTFLEVLFSVIIIGIGFIMVAAIFPVAIQQTQSSVNEAAGVAVGRDAIRYLQTTVTSSLLPTTAVLTAGVYVPQVAILPSGLTTLGNQLANTDHRYEWVGFYRRDLTEIWTGTPPAVPSPPFATIPSPYAQVWIFVAQATAEGQPLFTSPPVQLSQFVTPKTINAITGITLPFPNPTRNGTLVVSVPGIPGVTLGYSATTGNQYIEFPSDAGIPTFPTPAAPGAYVLIAGCPSDTTLVGQVLRLGNLYGGATWNLLPGNQMNITDDPNYLNLKISPDPIPTDGIFTNSMVAPPPTVFVLGSPPVTPFTYTGNINTGPTFAGPAQDVACVTGFVRLSN